MTYHIFRNYWNRHKKQVITYWCVLLVCVLVLNISIGKLLASLFESEARKEYDFNNQSTLYIISISEFDLNNYKILSNTIKQTDKYRSIWLNYNYSNLIVDGALTYYDAIDGNMSVKDGMLQVIPISINGCEESDVVLKAGRLPENAREFLSFGSDLNADFEYVYDPDNPPLHICYSLPSFGNVNVVGIIDDKCGLQGLSTTIDLFVDIYNDYDSFNICLLINGNRDNSYESIIWNDISEYATINNINVVSTEINEELYDKQIWMSFRENVFDIVAIILIILFILVSVSRYFYSELEYEYAVRIKLGCSQIIRYKTNLMLCLLISIIATLTAIPICCCFGKIFYSSFINVLWEVYY